MPPSTRTDPRLKHLNHYQEKDIATLNDLLASIPEGFEYPDNADDFLNS
jgi:hypothetical protein